MFPAKERPMSFHRTRSWLISAALLASFCAPAAALADDVVAAARAGGQVGEQADGYLGIAGGASPDVKARVDQINIQRKAIYTKAAQEKGVSINDFAAATACTLFKSKIARGEKYRDESGTWRTNDGSVKLPSFCGA
jgi:uncharacterized protein